MPSQRPILILEIQVVFAVVYGRKSLIRVLAVEQKFICFVTRDIPICAGRTASNEVVVRQFPLVQLRL